MVVRPALPSDYDAFTRLVPELAVPDPVPPRERFEAFIAPTMLIAAEDGSVLGYAFYELFPEHAHIRHMVTAPDARRRGVARALFREIEARVHAAGVAEWRLNVKPDNVAARTLYESLGFRRAYDSASLEITRALVARLPAHDVVVRNIEPTDDARVESELGIARGTMARARTRDGVLLFIERDGSVVGASVFFPSFPGAYPFAATRLDDARAFLEAMFSAIPSRDRLRVTIEDHKTLTDALVGAGASVVLDIVHMRGRV